MVKRTLRECGDAVALLDAAQALVHASFELADAGDFQAAASANAAARAANDRATMIAEEIEGRRWIKITDWIMGPRR